MTDWEERLRIGVVGLSAGAGASFVTTLLAGYFSQIRKRRTAVAELGKGGLYYALGMDKHFTFQEFHSFQKAAEGSMSLRRLENKWNEINWALKLPGECRETSGYREALRLIYGLAGQAAVFDFSGRRDEELWQLLKEMDLIVAVVDPLPEKLLGGQEQLERLKLSGLPVRCLINKDNRGVEKKELLRFLKVRRAEALPFFAPELVYSAQFDGESPWSRAEIREAAEPVFRRLAEDLFLS